MYVCPFSSATNVKIRMIKTLFKGRKDKLLAWNLLKLMHWHFFLMKSVRWREN